MIMSLNKSDMEVRKSWIIYVFYANTPHLSFRALLHAYILEFTELVKRGLGFTTNFTAFAFFTSPLPNATSSSVFRVFDYTICL